MSKTEDVAFAIISAAGDGRAKIQQALKEARRGNFGVAEDCLKEADEYLLIKSRPKNCCRKKPTVNSAARSMSSLPMLRITS